MKKYKNIIVMVLVAAIVGGIGFVGGMKFQEKRVQIFGQRGMSSNGQTSRFGIGGRMGQNGFRPVTGEILSVSGQTITVKMNDGTSRIVLVSDKTTVNKTDPGTVSDLKTGTSIAVFGTQNGDGTVTAQNVQLNPNLQRLTTQGQ